MTEDPSRPAGAGPLPSAGPGAPPPFPAAAPPSLYERSGRFFDGIRGWGIVRSDERWFAGVAGGLARRTSIDPLLARGLFVVFAVVTGMGLFLYGLAWLFLPQSDGRIHAQEALRAKFSGGVVGAVVFMLLDVNRFGFGWNWGWGWGMPGGLLLAIAAVAFVWWYSNNQRRGNPPRSAGYPPAPDAYASGSAYDQASGQVSGSTYGQTYDQTYDQSGGHTYSQSPAPGQWAAPAPAAASYNAPPRIDDSRPLHAITLATLGLALLAVAGVALWDAYVSDVIAGPVVIALAAALGVVAVGVVAAGLLGRRAGGLAPIGVLLAVALMVSPLVSSLDTSQPVGSKTVVLTSATDTSQEFSLGAGELILDLTDPRLSRELSPGSPVDVEASVSVGSLVVRVPDNVPVRVDSQVGLGVLPLDPQGMGGEGGADVENTVVYGGSGVPRIVVDASVGIGQIRVDQVRVPEVTS